MPPLDGFRAKLGRAKEHLHELQSSLDAISGDAKTYTIAKEGQPENGLYIFRINLLQELPITDWALMVGDCMHNTRSALDHLFWALLLLKHPGPAPADERKAGFPIYSVPSRFDKLKIANWVGEPATAILESLQPYHYGSPSEHLLAFLHQSDITDKHRLLITSVGIIQEGDVRVKSLVGKPSHRMTANCFKQERLYDGAVLCTVVVAPADSVMDVNIDVHKIGIFFERGGGKTYPVTKALEDAIEMAETIGGMFAKFFHNHGAPL